MVCRLSESNDSGDGKRFNTEITEERQRKAKADPCLRQAGLAALGMTRCVFWSAEPQKWCVSYDGAKCAVALRSDAVGPKGESRCSAIHKRNSDGNSTTMLSRELCGAALSG